MRQTVFPEIVRDIEAVKNGNVWAVDATSYFSRPGPRVVNGAEILAKIVHPELFGEPQSLEAVRVPSDMFAFGAAGSA